MSKFIIYKDKSEGTDQNRRWKLIDTNGENIANGGEGFLKTSIRKSIKTIIDNVDIDTPVFLDESKEDTDKGYRFEYLQSSEDNQWYWELRSGNNKTLAVGGEGFASKQNVERSIENVKVEIGRAKIAYENPEDDPAYEAKSQDVTKEDPSIPPGS